MTYSIHFQSALGCLSIKQLLFSIFKNRFDQKLKIHRPKIITHKKKNSTDVSAASTRFSDCGMRAWIGGAVHFGCSVRVLAQPVLPP